MFATATRNFVEEVDPRGSLIPVSSLNDTVTVLSVVIKKKRRWIWAKSKYSPTDFTLNDILAGDTPIEPVITEIDFLKYSSTLGDNIQAKVDASFIKQNVSVEGKDTSKLQSLFGSLKKEELDVQKLLKASKERVLDMTHCLVEQTMMNHKQVFGIVKERIVTTQPCSVIEEVQKEGQCGGGLALCGPTTKKVSLKENTSLGKDSNVTMEIPPHATLAYALIELEVKHDGHFKLCLTSGTNGGFEEVDGHQLLGVSTASAQFSETTDFTRALEQLKGDFETLETLPPQTKSSLWQKISCIIDDRAALASLENALDHMCVNVSAVSEANNEQIQAILDLAEQSGHAVIKALHVTLSALEALPDASLVLLKTCCSPVLLPDLKLLGQSVVGGREVPLSTMTQATLTEEVYQRVQRLFSSCKVSLIKDGDTLRTETHQEAHNLPMILCVAVSALTAFAQ